MQTSRPLAAILAAEVIGYNRSPGEAPVVGGDGLSGQRDRLIGTPIASFGGHIVKQDGGSVVARFTTNLAAVRCALAIQDHIKAREDGVEGGAGCAARIGIDLGHVTFESQAVKGEGTVIAEALRELTDAGGISITRIVYLQVRDELEAHFVDAGKLTFRHLQEPVQVYKFLPPWQQVPALRAPPKKWRPTAKFYAAMLCLVGASSLAAGGFGVWVDLQEPGMRSAVVASAKSALSNLSPFGTPTRDGSAGGGPGVDRSGPELSLADRLTPDRTFFETLGLSGGGTTSGGGAATSSPSGGAVPSATATSGRQGTVVASLPAGNGGAVPMVSRSTGGGASYGSVSYGRGSSGVINSGVASGGVINVGRASTGIRYKAQTWTKMSDQLRLSDVRSVPAASTTAAAGQAAAAGQSDEMAAPADSPAPAVAQPVELASLPEPPEASLTPDAGATAPEDAALAEAETPAAGVTLELASLPEAAEDPQLAEDAKLAEPEAGATTEPEAVAEPEPEAGTEVESFDVASLPDQGAEPSVSAPAGGTVFGEAPGAGEGVPVTEETLLVASAPAESGPEPGAEGGAEPAVLETSAGRPVEVRAFPGGDAAPVMVMPVRGSLVEVFGQDVGGDTTKGVILTARPEDSVLAPYDGQVVFADVFRGYGPVLIIEHGERYHTVLAGLEQIEAQVGQWVLAGEPIGNVGDPQDSSPEIYLELREQDRPIDPLPWLANLEEPRPNMSGVPTDGGIDVN